MDILVIDDEIDLCDIVSSLLRDAGYQVEFTTNGESAAQLVEAHHPPLLICDITMPAQSGIQLLEALKSRGSIHAVVMLTAHAESSMVIQALQLGAIDYLVKPFDSDDLLRKVPGWLEIGRRLQATAGSGTADAATIQKQLRMIELFRLQNKKTSLKSA